MASKGSRKARKRAKVEAAEERARKEASPDYCQYRQEDNTCPQKARLVAAGLLCSDDSRCYTRKEATLCIHYEIENMITYWRL